MNTEINYNENDKLTTKEICEYFDKEDCLPLGTNYRKHKMNILISIITLVIIVSLSLYNLCIK